ncbi:hypothetical protein TWF694_010155 [Orbilia ellipsospora]|uniref:Uncharacterized protein n=1 Tax=Orbilia ellipsospora TaxID=2528407 RepID=A0AAV9X9E0_9PEZI
MDSLIIFSLTSSLQALQNSFLLASTIAPSSSRAAISGRNSTEIALDEEYHLKEEIKQRNTVFIITGVMLGTILLLIFSAALICCLRRRISRKRCQSTALVRESDAESSAERQNQAQMGMIAPRSLPTRSDSTQVGESVDDTSGTDGSDSDSSSGTSSGVFSAVTTLPPYDGDEERLPAYSALPRQCVHV